MDQERTSSPHPPPDLLAMLGRIVGWLIGAVGDGVAGRVGGTLPDFEAQRKRTDYAFQEILRHLERPAPEAELLDNANQTIRQLGEEFYDEKVVQPMVRGLFPLVDLLQEGMTRENADRDLLLALLTQTKQFFALYGIEAYRHQPEDEFDPRTMKPLRRTLTNEPAIKDLVAESLQCGFRTPDRILRLETVSLYRFDINATPSSAL